MLTTSNKQQKKRKVMSSKSRYEINCERDLGSVRPLSDTEKNAKDEDVKCPRCLEYNLPKYYPGALSYWYVKHARVYPVSTYNDELCSPCGDDEAGQARMEQSNMSTEELGMLRDWLILSKENLK